MKKYAIVSFFIQSFILILSFCFCKTFLDMFLSFVIIYVIFLPYILKKHIKLIYMYLIILISLILFIILIVF